MQTGGPTPEEAADYSEEFDKFPFRKDFGITSSAGGSYKDVSFKLEYKGITLQIIINTVTTSGPESRAIAREHRQRAKMVLNVPDHALIIDVDKLRPNETVDLEAWRGFLRSRMAYMKWLIDTEVLTKDGFNQKMLDHFNKSLKH